MQFRELEPPSYTKKDGASGEARPLKFAESEPARLALDLL